VTPFVAFIFGLGALSHILPPRWFAALEQRYDEAPLLVKVLVPFAVIYLISVAAPAGIAPFIYFQF
jgi:alginate O-acetyltransferase complex protein AlgI